MPEFVTLPTGERVPEAWLTGDNGTGPKAASATTVLCFFGSRTLAGHKLAALIKGEILTRKPAMIVTAGEPDGVCQAAQKAARDTAVPLKLHFLDRKMRAAGAFEHRSKACLNECTHAIFVHDGKSTGTRNELALAKKKRIPLSYYVLTATGDFKYVPVGFGIDRPARRK